MTNTRLLITSLSLEDKVQWALHRIAEYNEELNNKTYVAYSGGKDSIVLLHLARQVNKQTPAVYIDTGLEFPEVRSFALATTGLIKIKPKMTFHECLKRYGIPYPSKEVAGAIYMARNTGSEKLRNKIIKGEGRTLIPKRYKYLLSCKFDVSAQCCYHLKKKPSERLARSTNYSSMVGVRADESRLRGLIYNTRGCLTTGKTNRAWPLALWTDADIWQYIKENNLAVPEIYSMGYPRTGCIFCLFGADMDTEPRMVRLKNTHPKLYNYCMDKLGYKEFLDYVGVPYE